MKPTVAVVGAGASGLAAVKACLEDGLLPVCFEKDHDIGGLWNYTSDVRADSGNVYKSCVINTSKEMFAYSDFPVPPEFPPFMPHSYVLRYLRMYADNFRLLRHIRFGTCVKYIRKTADFARTGRWEVGVTDSKNQDKTPVCSVFDYVMVCSGHHVHPSLPDVPGMDKFQGVQIHSSQYKTPEFLADKRVVIVGLGNSAVDIAVDVSRVASQVYVSTRRGAWVVSRMGPFGIPMDMLANSRYAFLLPRSWLQSMVEIMANLTFDHEAMGLSPGHRLLESHPTINDELPLRIITGSVKVKPDVAVLTETSVFFEDGTEEQIDAVVYASGYEYRCPFVDNNVIDLGDNRVDLYKFMFPPTLPRGTLAMIGLIQPVGAFPPVSEIQSRWFTRLASGLCKLPAVTTMVEDVREKNRFLDQHYYKSKKHTCETFWIEYMDDIACQFGARPDLLRLMFRDPSLATRCFLGPCVPAQYRLQGPGSWHGASNTIRRAFTNNTDATRTRKCTTHEKSKKLFSDFVMVILFLGVLMFLYDTGLSCSIIYFYVISALLTNLCYLCRVILVL